MNLFLIGNSFTINASRYLPELTAEGGFELTEGRAEVGGCSMQRHWEQIEAAERGEPEGKFYAYRTMENPEFAGEPYRSMREILGTGEWDKVIFHQASINSSDVSSYRPYAGQIVDYVRSLAPGAEILLNQTWAYRADATQFGDIGGGQSSKDPEEMWRYSRAAYHTVAEELSLPLIPTGDAFWKVESDPQWHYRRDASFDFDGPKYPDLPDQTHSLHTGYYWSEDRQFGLDFKHTSNAGAYLGSLIWFGFLFDVSPEDVSFVAPGVSTEFAAYLRSVAAETLRESRPALVRNNS